MILSELIDEHSDANNPIWRGLLSKAINLLITVEDWHEIGAINQPVFENSWANSGGTKETAAFSKNPFNVVTLKGNIDTGVTGTVAFTMPEGYRPSKDVYFVCFSISGGGGSGGHASAKIDANGTVTITMSGTSSDISLNGIIYKVE